MLDVSASGIALLASEQIPPGSPVMVNYGGANSIGEVRNCVSSPQGFRIGVEIER
jgi:hypothetical protein